MLLLIHFLKLTLILTQQNNANTNSTTSITKVNCYRSVNLAQESNIFS